MATRARENADGARLDAPLASPVLVTPNLGTPSAGVMTNATGIPAAQVSGVLPSGVTGGSGLTALGTVIAGNLSNSAIVYPEGHVIYTNQHNKISAGASSDPDTSFVDTGLTVTVPSATIAACSKILISASGACVIQNSSYSITQYHLRRVESGTTSSLVYHSVGFLTTVTNGFHGNWGITWIDTSLGSGDHTYKISIKGGGANHSAAVTYFSYSGTSANITVIGVV
jgi:hypothetical protein